MATMKDTTFALRYSVLIIGLVQLLSVFVARVLLKGCAKYALAPPDELAGPQPLIESPITSRG
jgi:hypothetical protein